MDINGALRTVFAELHMAERVLGRSTVPPREHPDVLQQCRLAAWSALKRGAIDVGHRPAIRRWVRRTAETLVAAWFTQVGRVRRPKLVLVEQAPRSTVPSAEQMHLEQAPFAALDEALAKLAVDQPTFHAVVRDYMLRGRTMADVAREHGIPEATAWNRLRLGRARLRHMLRSHDPTGGMQ